MANMRRVKAEILQGEHTQGDRFVASRRMFNWALRPTDTIRAGGRSSKAPPRCPRCKLVSKKSGRCIWNTQKCEKEGRILNKLTCRCKARPPSRVRRKTTRAESRPRRVTAELQTSTVNAALRAFHKAEDRLYEVSPQSKLLNYHMPSTALLKANHVRDILKHHARFRVVAPQLYTRVEVLGPRSSMLSENRDRLGRFHTVGQSNVVGSGSGGDRWWMVNSNLLTFLNRRTYAFERAASLPRTRPNPARGAAHAGHMYKGGRLSARRYYNRYGHGAIGNVEMIHGVPKRLTMRANGSPYWA